MANTPEPAAPTTSAPTTAAPAAPPAPPPAPPTAAPAARKRRGHASLTRRNRIGLRLIFLIGLINIPSVLEQTPEGEEGPPIGVLVLDSICGVVMVVATVIAWRSGRRGAIRLAAGVTILQALSAVPAFFVDVPTVIKIVVTVAVVVSFVAVVLALSPARRSSDPVG